MLVKVKSGKRGFIGGRLRKSGEEFECKKPEFSSVWMDEVKVKSKPVASTKVFTPEKTPILDSSSDANLNFYESPQY